MFGVAHYAAAVVFAVACWGFGRALLSRIGAPLRRDPGLETAMAAAAGLGLFVCIFQAIAIAGLFGRATVIGAVALGLLAARCRHRPGCASFGRASGPWCPSASPRSWPWRCWC